MNFDTDEGQPGDEVLMTIKASPASLCAYETVDKSVHLQGGNNQLDAAKLSSVLRRYNLDKSSRPLATGRFVSLTTGRSEFQLHTPPGQWSAT